MKFVRSKQKDVAAAPAAPRAPKQRRKPSPADRRNRDGKGGRGAQKFVLVLGDEGAILIYMRGDRVLRRLFAVSPQPDHTSSFVELLASHPSVPLYVLADVLDQQYVRHSFPPVSALSVNNLVRRRLDRDFQSADLTGSIRLGREKTGRKEWQYLLIALAGTPLIQQWLDLLVEQPNEMKGIFLSPVEGQIYIASLHKELTNDKPLPWQLLVSHHKVSGFRQIVLRDGKLAFTRVTQAIDDALPAVIAGNIEQEIMNTLEYLRRMGFTENNALEIIVVTSQEVSEALDVKRFKAGQSFVLTPLEVADLLGLEQAALSADRFGDVVMGAAFARAKKHGLKLFTAYGAKLAQVYQARLGVKLLGALGAVALLGLSATNLLQATSDRSAAAATEDQRRPLKDQLESVRKAIQGLNKNVALKSAIMLTYDTYMKDLHTPEEFIDTLAPLLVPEARILKFTWGASSAADAKDGPLEMKVDFEFVGNFPAVEQLSKFVEKYVATLKTQMPEYTITNLPYPWESKTASNVEISFDQQAPTQTIGEGENKVTLIFHGPKPKDGAAGAPASGGAGAMGAMP